MTGDRSRDSGEENGLKPQWSNGTLFHVVLATVFHTPEKSSYRNSDVCIMHSGSSRRPLWCESFVLQVGHFSTTWCCSRLELNGLLLLTQTCSHIFWSHPPYSQPWVHWNGCTVTATVGRQGRIHSSLSALLYFLCISEAVEVLCHMEVGHCSSRPLSGTGVFFPFK